MIFNLVYNTMYELYQKYLVYCIHKKLQNNINKYNQSCCKRGSGATDSFDL